MWPLPIKKEGEQFYAIKDSDFIPRRLFGRLCWMKFIVGVALHLDPWGARGIAYEWRGQVWTCYMRVSPPWRNVCHRFLVDHVHDAFWDPFVDPVVGRTHLHTVDGSADPWTKKVLTPEGTGCWCLAERSI